MFLKRIELQGFKSFADKSIITFDSDVTGIVGPNGCGKSNINDAIRWVLGEQSVKSLRGGNSMSDIIFSGSAQRKAVNLAEVTLVFDNTKRFFDIAYDEVEITRRLRRQNSEAEYLINKTPCRLKDITDLVMDTGLGRDSLSIITQGNISSFAEAKPEERRALFEEAAGVAKYKKRKNVSLHKLKNTQDNLARLEDIILELERQVSTRRSFPRSRSTSSSMRSKVFSSRSPSWNSGGSTWIHSVRCMRRRSRCRMWKTKSCERRCLPWTGRSISCRGITPLPWRKATAWNDARSS